jgi:hypothetical protein
MCGGIELIMMPVTPGTTLPPKNRSSHIMTHVVVKSLRKGMGVPQRLAKEAYIAAILRAFYPSYPPYMCMTVPPINTPSMGAERDMNIYVLNTVVWGTFSTLRK